MGAFTQGMTILKNVIMAYGIFRVAWGMVTIGNGLKDKTGPEIGQGAGTAVGGAMIILAAALIDMIKLG